MSWRLAAPVLALALAGCGGGTAVAPLRAPRLRPLHLARRRAHVGIPGAHRAPHARVPILMYHVIGHRTAATPNAELWVLPGTFAAEMHALRHAGYHAVTLQQVWDAWHHDGLLPSRPIVVSFDDGYFGQERDALPTLRRLRWPGVLNLKLGNLRDMGGPRGIRRLIAGGWEIDSHTITHPDLTTVSDAQLRRELVGSRRRLRRLFGATAARFFCYPSGRYDPRVAAAVRRAGYLAATTTLPGLADRADRYALFRVRVNGSDTPSTLLARLRALVAAPQPPAPPAFAGGE